MDDVVMTRDTIMLGYVTIEPYGSTDQLLKSVAAALRLNGLRIAGALGHQGPVSSDGRHHMDLAILSTGEVIRISQDLGPAAKGCRLNIQELTRAAGQVAGDLGKKPDLLILNKFGKTEAEGGGFRAVIGEAILQDVPVLIAVGRGGAAEFAIFAQGLETHLPSTVDAIVAWAKAAKD
jgi:hypothetical protein